MRSRAKKKNVFFVFCLVFICTFCAIFLALFLYRRYSYTNEKMDLSLYFSSDLNDATVFYNDKRLSDEASSQKKYKDGTVYFSLPFVKEHFNSTFYYDTSVKRIIYTGAYKSEEYAAEDTYKNQSRAYILLDEPFLSIDLVKEKSDIICEKFLDDDHKRIFIYDKSSNRQNEYATIQKEEAVRYKGGNKSPILTELSDGAEVKIINRMKKWCCVKTTDGFIGYVRNKKLSPSYTKEVNSEYIPENYTHRSFKEKVVLSFHQQFSTPSKKDFETISKKFIGMNILAPTWFRIENNQGGIENIIDDNYIDYCHLNGIEVWPTINNFDKEGIKSKILFSSYYSRKKIIDNLILYTKIKNLDGVVLDIEDIAANAGEDYLQFVRECAATFRMIDKSIAVCQPPPVELNERYKFEEIGKLVDFMIIMAYDEHTKNSDPGPVASIDFIKQAVELGNAKMDPERIIYALPFYTRVWKTKDQEKLEVKSYGALQFEKVRDKLGLVESKWDEKTCYNYASNVENDTLTQVWIEDERSLNEKMKIIKQSKGAGTAAWKQGMELDGFFDIISMNK